MLAFAAVLVALACPLAAPAQTTPNYLPPPAQGLELTDKRGQRLPLELNFTDASGRVIALADLFNQTSASGKPKPVVVLMLYLRCPILCPAVLEKMTDALNKVDFTVGSDYDVAIVSFDPRDRPADAALHKEAQLMAYARPASDEIRAGWRFLTSDDAAAARTLADSLGFPYRFLPDSDQFSHGSAVFIATPDGRLSRCLNGLSYPPDDVRLALLEATDGRIGSIFDRWTLFCYHFDPSSGTYTLAAMRVMRIGAILCMILVGSLLALMLRHERTKRRRRAAGQAPTTPPAAAHDSNERFSGPAPGLMGHAR